MPEDDEITSNKFAAMADKVVALTGAKLDALLEDQGIDPSEYSAAPEEQKKVLFLDALHRQKTTQSMGSLSGLMTIKTIEGVDSIGLHTIGVIAMYYDKTKQLADDIIKRRVPMLKRTKGLPLEKYLPKTSKSLSETFGTRLVFSEEGRPVILSYGQWSFSYKGENERKKERGRDFANKKAVTESRAQIVEFLNSRAKFVEVSEDAFSIEESVIKDRDGNYADGDIAEMVDTLEQKMNANYSGKISGMRVLKRWKYGHPNGHEIVGVVTFWSQKNTDDAANVRNFKSSNKVSHTKASGETKHDGASGVSEGVGMDLDF